MASDPSPPGGRTAEAPAGSEARRPMSRMQSWRVAESALPQYQGKKDLGAGSFARVLLMEHRATGHQVAVKMLKKERLAEERMEDKVRREIDIMLRLRHPNIIRLYRAIDTPRYILLVMEFCGGQSEGEGELFNYITVRGRLSEGASRAMFQGILAAVEYCHRRGVVHRDLKPENILLSRARAVKVADFGLSNVAGEGRFLRTSCGSPNYAAPEVISGHLYGGFEVDVWSCGVVLYTMLCGCLPFMNDSIAQLYQRIKAGVYPRPTHVSPAAQDLIAAMLTVDPTQRATVPEIRRHPWLLPWFLPRDVAQLQAALGPAALPPLNPASLANLQGVHVAARAAARAPGEVWAGGAVLQDLRDLGVHVGWPPASLAELAGAPVGDDCGVPGGSGGDRDEESMRAERARLMWREDGELKRRFWAHEAWAPGAVVIGRRQLLLRWLDIMKRVCMVLHKLDARWKVVGPYTLRCVKVVTASERRPQAGGALLPLASSRREGSLLWEQPQGATPWAAPSGRSEKGATCRGDGVEAGHGEVAMINDCVEGLGTGVASVRVSANGWHHALDPRKGTSMGLFGGGRPDRSAVEAMPSWGGGGGGGGGDLHGGPPAVTSHHRAGRGPPPAFSNGSGDPDGPLRGAGGGGEGAFGPWRPGSKAPRLWREDVRLFPPAPHVHTLDLRFEVQVFREPGSGDAVVDLRPLAPSLSPMLMLDFAAAFRQEMLGLQGRRR